MGLCHTEEDTSNAQRSNEIDKQLERDRGRREKEYKILLLGQYGFLLCRQSFPTCLESISA